MSNNFKPGYLATGVCSIPNDGPGERYNRHAHTSTYVDYKSPVCASYNPECNSSWGIYDNAKVTQEEFDKEFGPSFGMVQPESLPGVRRIHGACFPTGIRGPPEMGCNPIPNITSTMLTQEGCPIHGNIEGFGETLTFPVKLAIFVLVALLIYHMLNNKQF